jgi:hypothetical protein
MLRVRHCRTLVALATAGAIAACSHGSDSTAPGPGSVTGRWSQGANLTDAVNHQTHIHTGSFVLAQRNGAITGSGQQTGFCHAPSGNYEGPIADGVPFSITGALVTGSRVSFTTDLCSYDGTLSPDGEHMNGTMQCAYTYQGVSFHWAGDWLADRQH